MDNTTKALAARLGIQAASIRAAVCRHGSYYGVRPLTLPNGRLLWPEDSYQRILNADKRTAKAA